MKNSTSFKKGHKKRGGRVKGVQNMRSRLVMEKIDELGIDPFEVLLLLAGNKWKALGYKSETVTRYSKNGDLYEENTIPVEVRCHAAGKACDFAYPKLKVIEADIKNDNITVVRFKRDGDSNKTQESPSETA